MQFTSQNSQISPKLKQFQDELNVLCEKYQYQLRARITSDIEIVDIVPASTKTKKFKLTKAGMKQVKERIARKK